MCTASGSGELLALLGQVFQVRLERAALDVFHDHVGRAVLDVEVVNLNDVRVTQRGHVFGLALETGDEVLVGGQESVHQLERDVAVEAGLVRLVDLRHAAPAEVLNNAVFTNSLAGQAGGVFHGPYFSRIAATSQARSYTSLPHTAIHGTQCRWYPCGAYFPLVGITGSSRPAAIGWRPRFGGRRLRRWSGSGCGRACRSRKWSANNGCRTRARFGRRCPGRSGKDSRTSGSQRSMGCRGRVNVTVVPLPTVLSTLICPWCASTKPLAMASPRPAPPLNKPSRAWPRLRAASPR